MDATVSVNDISARIYTAVEKGETLEDYYRAVDSLRELLYSREWLSAVTGFYLNCITREPYQRTVRIAYLTASMTSRPVEVYQAYADKKGLITAGFDELTPDIGVFTKYYGGDELLFRRYLAAYSWIGMDLLKYDFENSIRIFSSLRKQPRASYRSFLETLFLEGSPHYQAWPVESRELFWQAFLNWPKSPADWAHMMVNMMLGCDHKPLD